MRALTRKGMAHLSVRFFPFSVTALSKAFCAEAITRGDGRIYAALPEPLYQHRLDDLLGRRGNG